MKYNELAISPHKPKNRVGRGIAAGQGKTAGRGTKGQNSRAGSKGRVGFEGGQNPLMQRIPKLRGFTPIRKKPTTITTDQLDALKSGVVDNYTIYEARLTKNPRENSRLVLKGAVTKKFTVKLQGASAEAQKSIVAAGGTFTKVIIIPKKPTLPEK